MIWDIFCKVIDNYGDIGVTWRLARQLATEHAIAVRLWVDDLDAFHQICPEIDPCAHRQCHCGVEVRRWTEAFPEVRPGAVVIEALACDLPDIFIQRMADMSPPPLWLNLEYLSAEDWVEGVHGLPSPHPRLPLTKHFFMPGYTSSTGGLTRENGLFAARAAFQADISAQRTFWRELTGERSPALAKDVLRVSLFCYDNAALPGLLDRWASGMRRILAIVPAGKALPRIAAWFDADASLKPGMRLERGALSVLVTPMLDLDRYERLLWACDLNFVRGEDSFVRAQYAARPMVWQAYPQEAEAHLDKLEAFLARYGALATPALQVNAKFWRAWNREADVATLWPAFLDARVALLEHAGRWANSLAEHTDLAANLLKFHRKWL